MCRSLEQLTDSAFHISPYFLDYWSIVSLHNYNCIDNPTSYIQSLFQQASVRRKQNCLSYNAVSLKTSLKTGQPYMLHRIRRYYRLNLLTS